MQHVTNEPRSPQIFDSLTDNRFGGWDAHEHSRTSTCYFCPFTNGEKWFRSKNAQGYLFAVNYEQDCAQTRRPTVLSLSDIYCSRASDESFPIVHHDTTSEFRLVGKEHEANFVIGTDNSEKRANLISDQSFVFSWSTITKEWSIQLQNLDVKLKGRSVEFDKKLL